MPLIKQKSQINDNLSLSYFFANNGIPLYPNCRGGVDSLNDEFLKSLPRNSYLALGVHGFIKRKEQMFEWQLWIEKVINILNPKGFIVIGHLPSKIIEMFKNKVNFFEYDSFMELRNKEVNYAY